MPENEQNRSESASSTLTIVSYTSLIILASIFGYAFSTLTPFLGEASAVIFGSLLIAFGMAAEHQLASSVQLQRMFKACFNNAKLFATIHNFSERQLMKPCTVQSDNNLNKEKIVDEAAA